ncbi:DUF192 domain-containing protein [Nitrosomonas marina]|uniref:DUF192 domain-containing protein n=1 Tax=Nitrosomonas marina TaxID=917 RepID=A0A1H8CBU4_9PROT|nr:DUF192 domain-containing protein [Nitrosomonas marina]SEM91718.1 hypothetical protein SAMN05216325_10484 [Nitrosomonas marina]
MRFMSLVCSGCLFLLTFSQTVASTNLQYVSLQIAGHTLSAEVADTHASRARGLMFRESLDANTGMLFVFPKNAYLSMWMKNTVIPLSVAFIDDEGIIINIADMQPNTHTAHYSTNLAKYALEMNIGWFSRRKIDTGDRVIGLELISATN